MAFHENDFMTGLAVGSFSCGAVAIVDLTVENKAAIHAELDKLLAETDEYWLNVHAGQSILEKIRHLQMCTNAMRNAIRNKGVTIPNPQPFRTLHERIDEIEVSDNGTINVGTTTNIHNSAGSFAVADSVRAITATAY